MGGLQLDTISKIGPLKRLDNFVEYEGIKLSVDPLSRKRTDLDDNTFDIFLEEQPCLWEWSKNLVEETIARAEGSIDFLDVGTGSGIFALLADRYTSAENIIGIEKVKNVCEKAKKNGDINKANVDFRHEKYHVSSVPQKSCKVIFMNPPYHIYPPEIEDNLPQHARGGFDGQGVFREQIVAANYHLAEGGILVYHKMSVAKESVGYGHVSSANPEDRQFAKAVMKDCCLRSSDILRETSTHNFLTGVYQGKHDEFISRFSEQYPYIHFENVVLLRKKEKPFLKIPPRIYIPGLTWTDRILLHREIAKHAYSK
tara:strand:+ start:1549 stop:2487 length:939 start_codon:yes stop_codon:yes gene_type:complete